MAQAGLLVGEILVRQHRICADVFDQAGRVREEACLPRR